MRGLLGSAFGLAIFTAANALVFACLTLIAGQRLNFIDEQKAEATASLRSRQELLNTFVKHVPAAVAMFDRDMRYLQASDRWCSDFSLHSSQIFGRSQYDIFPDLPERWKEIHRRVLAGETLRAEEDRWDRSDGSTIWLHWECRPWGGIREMPQGLLIFSEDITRRKQTEETLRESEATIRALLETAAQGILAADSNGSIVIANQMMEQMFGYTHQELIGMQHDDLLPGRFRERHAVHRATFAFHPTARPMGMGMELLGIRKNGVEFPVEVSLSAVQTHTGALAVAFITDITLRKQTEVALKNSEQELRDLAGRLLSAQEDERRRLARDLHDEITQQLAFLSIEIGKAASQIDAPQIHERCQSFQREIIEICEDVRRLSHGLHPSVIEDLGLSTALEELCNEFAAHYGIRIEFDGPGKKLGLSPTVSSQLFRVAQEALYNAVKHAQANSIRVSLQADSRKLQLFITDNGVGFPSTQQSSAKGLGLLNMKERMRMLNGTLSISSTPGAGTQVQAFVPRAQEQV